MTEFTFIAHGLPGEIPHLYQMTIRDKQVKDGTASVSFGNFKSMLEGVEPILYNFSKKQDIGVIIIGEFPEHHIQQMKLALDSCTLATKNKVYFYKGI